MTGLTGTATPVVATPAGMNRLAAGSSGRRLRWWREVLMIGAWYVGYEGVRAVSPTQVRAAHRHAEQLLGFERWAHLDPERGLNRLLSGSSHLGVLAGGYYAILHFAVTLVALVWLYRRHRALYQHARTVLISASTASLVVFWFYPVAPPRLAMPGLQDTVVTHNVLGAGHAASTGTLVDLYAALPSLHVGWAFWVAAVIVRARGTSPYRQLAWLYPVTTALVVLATANHYLVDAAAGVTVIALAELAYRGQARRASVHFRHRTVPIVVPEETRDERHQRHRPAAAGHPAAACTRRGAGLVGDDGRRSGRLRRRAEPQTVVAARPGDHRASGSRRRRAMAGGGPA